MAIETGIQTFIISEARFRKF